MHIPKIVITGGPCGGKTTAMTFLIQKLSSIGYYPIVVPEAPTILMQSGITPVGGVFPLRVFQEHVIDLIVHLENTFHRAAVSLPHPKPILICDRGIMDALAYMPEDMFWDVVRSRGLDRSSMRDARYLGIFHLRSAALGAEAFYTTANNSVRLESVDEARIVDERTLQAWVGHPHVAIIDNEGKNFDDKLGLLWKKICRVLGFPIPLEIERKFLVEPVDLMLLGIPHQAVDIEQRYLVSPAADTVLRIRKRGQYGAYTYFETRKQEVRPSVRVETERFITPIEYLQFAQGQKSGTVILNKKRHCFVFKNQYFEFDVFAAPNHGLHLLEIELTEEQDVISLPPWIKVIRDVTDEREYSNYALATIK
ncbi:MAG: hypothetical protein A2845_06240 [Candidatus Lloydbacteria bacterium RIFCSPHIGHO2_01_FULL_49_22]|uniref:CYTH domain-containing protein n=1 Tax=Candidatus Lloydbacteria bacterium RIFCSPHIGHO2_01_FULL_49_22 TaxID=1798658 RepID=A0A1G2CVT7_9BACT|nr:MAG: hypothetical protein A2845_06240 [Candidatus Lloydbacteria bacterium RIFCSPHIGHO2_01_FULL_49_22]OGZ09447.1 MAG: hypothetical protein A3C14_00435 [Candidatus Lloydbacteria bacterium RIFCSPHIGHO2_02_FULL_50_18]